MKGFPESFLEELKSRCRIENIISRYISLEKKGRNFWGRCPFHLEKTPSFCVNEVDQFYHCFGCKAGGNVIKFIMEIESISFYDAVKMLADMCGLPLPVVDVDEAEVKRQKEEKERKKAELTALVEEKENGK